MNELSPELQAKYPTAHHAPLPDCPRCHGKGERWVEASGPFTAKWKPCMCIFVEHEHVGLVSEMFAEMISREKARLNHLEPPEPYRPRCIACGHVHRTRFMSQTDGPCERPIEDGVYCDCKAEVLREG